MGGGNSLGQSGSQIRATMAIDPRSMFVNQPAVSPYGGTGSAYTIDVLNSLRPLGVQANQYPNIPPPSNPVPHPAMGGGGGGGYASLTPAQRFALSGLGGSPRNSGATFSGPGANMVAPPWFYTSGNLANIRNQLLQQGIHSPQYSETLGQFNHLFPGMAVGPQAGWKPGQNSPFPGYDLSAWG